ncbi:MAG: L-threonylcarbamoyladenylate synthase [Crenarchaeota archaeon]|nr:L-threonylcarbamoyladenylate synthase [Thermoproteota archaeon]
MVKIVHISNRYSCLREIVEICVRAIENNELLVLPTETVYGILAPDRDQILNRLYRIKMRYERFTVHASDICQIIEKYELKESYIEILKKLFPGPVTAIVETVRGEKIGFRVPDHDLIREVLKRVGPAYMPSANKKDNPSPITGRDVLEELSNDVDMIIDEGYTRYCIDSTVVDLTKDPPEILRSGAFPVKDLERILKVNVKIPENVLRLEPFPAKKYLKNRNVIMLRDIKNMSKLNINVRDCILLSSVEKYEENYKILDSFSIILLYGSERDILSMFRGVYECLRKVEKLPNKYVIIIPPELSYDTLPIIERFLRSTDTVI